MIVSVESIEIMILCIAIVMLSMESIDIMIRTITSLEIMILSMESIDPLRRQGIPLPRNCFFCFHDAVKTAAVSGLETWSQDLDNYTVDVDVGMQT